jgi:glycine cleavage system aminomethyltransferase T/glycine/D-amino acid oxidase-like deaminating enzyme
MSTPKVVIIGAGVVGASLADELSQRGWTDVTVVDQGSLPLPGGSSSHAPGMVFQNHASKAMSEMAQYTVNKFLTLEHEGKTAFMPVGGLEIATTPERMKDLHRRLGWARSWGLNPRILSPKECVALQPLLDESRVLAGLYNDTDGAARAVVAVNAQLRAAEKRGVRILERHEVVGIRTDAGAVTGVETNQGILDAEIIVCCAGIWGPKIADMVGITLPMTVLAHQVAWTEPMPSLAGHTAEATKPMLRHMDEGLYYRDRYDRLEVGSFAHRALPVNAHDILSVDEALVMPSVQPFTEEDFDAQWRDTQRLMPETRQTKVKGGMNGLMAFTVDNFPLLGPAAELSGFWVAEGVWVTHSAGVGRAMAEWLIDGGSTTFDLHECELSRFERHQLSPEFISQKDIQNYLEVYDIKHPLQPMEEPRPLRVSPFHVRQEELGAVFLEGAGWERPHWFESNAPLVAGRDIPQFEGWSAQYWSPIVAAEAQRTRETVGLFDMTPLKRLEVVGPDAEPFLQALTTGNVARSVGSVTYCLLLDERGGIRSDVTVARLGRDHYQVGANGNIDLHWLERHVGSYRVTVRDVTPGTCCLGLWGPRARDVISGLSDIDFDAAAFKYFRAKQGYVGNVPVTALRVSYVGELGWELYTTSDMGLKLWDTLWMAGQQHGIIAAGRGALNSLRLEKGYRAFGTDMTFEHNPYEAGLGFAVKLDSDFIGREALLERKDQAARRLACLTYGDTSEVLLGGEPVLANDTAVGYVTSAAYGYTIGRGIAYAWLPSELAEVGQDLQIQAFDRTIAATVAAEPLFDPDMTRVRS